MVQPANYTLNVPDPTQSMVTGVQSGLQLVGAVQQHEAQQAALQKAQLAAQRQAAMQAELGQISESPSAAAISKFAVKYPEFSEQAKRTHDMLSADEKKERIGQAWKFYSAASSETPEVAAELALEQATAYRNRGMEAEAKELEDLARLAKLDPKTAQISAASYLAATDPDKFGETASKLEADRRARALEGADLTEKQAKAHSAAVAAKFAESEAAVDLQKKGWDIFKIQEDAKIAKENTKIAALNAATAKESNEIKREDLKAQLAEATRKRDIELREKAAKLESERGSMDNMLNTIEQVLKTPAGVLDDITGPIDTWLPTLGDAEKAAEKKVELLSAQAFLAQLPNMSGFGSLSDAEKKAIESSLQSFSLEQDTEDLLKNVREAKRLLVKMRSNLATKYGVPDSAPDVPEAAIPTDAEAETIMKSLGL